MFSIYKMSLFWDIFFNYDCVIKKKKISIIIVKCFSSKEAREFHPKYYSPMEISHINLATLHFLDSHNDEIIIDLN